ncbi:MAG: M48 family metalloprotease [Solirubrobacteraceae bacterium]
MNTRADLTEIADALNQRAGTPHVRVLIATPWMPFRGWRYGMVRDLHGQPTIFLEPRLLKLGLQAIRAAIAHELGHIALGHRFGRSSGRWTRRDDALMALSLAMGLLCVIALLAVKVLAWSFLTLIGPFTLAGACILAVQARQGPPKHDLEYQADAYAIRLLGERESTIALLESNRPSRLAPGPLKHLEEWVAWRTDAHPPDSARIQHARTVPLPTTPAPDEPA